MTGFQFLIVVLGLGSIPFLNRLVLSAIPEYDEPELSWGEEAAQVVFDWPVNPDRELSGRSGRSRVGTGRALRAATTHRPRPESSRELSGREALNHEVSVGTPPCPSRPESFWGEAV